MATITLGKCKKTELGEEIAKTSEEIGRKDKMDCLWDITDLYLFEGGKHAQILCRPDSAWFPPVASAWKKMKLST